MLSKSEEKMQSFNLFKNDMKKCIENVYNAKVRTLLMLIQYDPIHDTIIPDCDAFNGDVAFDITFEVFPNFILKFSTHSLCEIFAKSRDNVFDSACLAETLRRINNALYQHLNSIEVYRVPYSNC